MLTSDFGAKPFCRLYFVPAHAMRKRPAVAASDA